jgi:hypothetical protein
VHGSVLIAAARGTNEIARLRIERVRAPRGPPEISPQQTTSGDRFLPRVLLAATFRSEAISEARPTSIEKREPHFVGR